MTDCVCVCVCMSVVHQFLSALKPDPTVNLCPARLRAVCVSGTLVWQLNRLPGDSIYFTHNEYEGEAQRVKALSCLQY